MLGMSFEFNFYEPRKFTKHYRKILMANIFEFNFAIHQKSKNLEQSVEKKKSFWIFSIHINLHKNFAVLYFFVHSTSLNKKTENNCLGGKRNSLWGLFVQRTTRKKTPLKFKTSGEWIIGAFPKTRAVHFSKSAIILYSKENQNPSQNWTFFTAFTFE